MKLRPLLQIYFIYHEADAEDILPHQAALDRAFECVRFDRVASDLEEVPSVWERVQFRSIPNATSWQAQEWKDDPTIATLFLVMVTEKLVADASMKEVLDTVAQLLPKRPEDGACDLLAYTMSETAIKHLPPIFKSRQVKPMANLGEHRIAPHKLGLVALHRARLLLGETRQSDKLKIFISHAKFDGIFLAQSLKSSIEQADLSAWYDAEDIEDGSDWLTSIQDAASSCVFLALRTNAYELRKTCRDEFMMALTHGVPIVVVDAIMQPISDSSPMPFACVPNVRMPDGNTYRVLVTTLREHLRLLLMQATATEKAPGLARPRVWPRLPSPAAIRQAIVERQKPTKAPVAGGGPAAPEGPGAEKEPECWLVPKAYCYEAEFLQLRDLLVASNCRIAIEHLETFRPTPKLT